MSGAASAAGAGRLVVCPTPIGNLEDVTLRVLSALRDADVVACEDTRRTRVLLERYGVSDRPVAVCRELTKVHEEVVRGSAADLAARYADSAPRGEVVLVVGAAGAEGADIEDERAHAALRRLVDAGAKPRAAAKVVAELTGVPANALYRDLTARRS